MKYILALDQGTTSSRAIIFDKAGEIVGMAQQEFTQIYPHQGWVEHDPQELLASQIAVMVRTFVTSNVSVNDIEAIGITNQRETTFVWDKNTGIPVYNAIVWQCRRTASFCDSLKEQGKAEMIYDKTGLVLDAYFSASKVKWILDNVEGAREKAENGDLMFGTADTYIMWHLSKGEIFATDYTNASRTMLFNIHTLEWDEDLLELFNIPKSMLPTVHPSSFEFGRSTEEFIGRRIPITGVCGDQQSALFGQLCVEKGDLKNTYGTGCFLLMNTGDTAVKSQNGLITTLGASLDARPDYVLEGSVFIGGAVVQWLRDEMRLIKSASDTERYATAVESSNGVYVVPSFTGLGAPYWDADPRGTVVGLSRGTKKEHFIRASVESIAYQSSDLVFAMEKDAGHKIKSLRVDGGASANNFLLQFQSDILNCDVIRPKVIETTALGAAYLAGLKVGYWKDIEDIKQNIQMDCKFVPSMDEAKRERRLNGWKKAVRQCRAE